MAKNANFSPAAATHKIHHLPAITCRPPPAAWDWPHMGNVYSPQ